MNLSLLLYYKPPLEAGSKKQIGIVIFNDFKDLKYFKGTKDFKE